MATTEGGQEGHLDSEQGRVAVSRDFYDREFTADVVDFTELSQLKIVPLVLAKR